MTSSLTSTDNTTISLMLVIYFTSKLLSKPKYICTGSATSSKKQKRREEKALMCFPKTTIHNRL